MKDKISFKEFLELEKKIEIKTGLIKNVMRVANSEKLLELTVQFGEEIKTSVTNIMPHFKRNEGDDAFEKAYDALNGKTFLFITNLEPTKMMGLVSEAMIVPGPIENGQLLRVLTEEDDMIFSGSGGLNVI